VTQLRDIHVAAAEQLKTNIAVASKLTIAAFPFSGSAPPFIEVWPRLGADYVGYYDESDSDSGSTVVRLQLQIELATADGQTAFDMMTDLLSWEGPSSIRAAFMGRTRRTLGGVVDSTTVLNPSWNVNDETLSQSATVPFDVRVQKET
jgi:hypothetical protein